MPDIDQLLPKPADEMSVQDTLDFMDEVMGELTKWTATLGEREPFRMPPDKITKAMQCISWGREALMMLKESAEAVDIAPEYDLDEAVFFIRNRTDLHDDVIRKVLDANEAYMEDKGIIEPDPTPGTRPATQ